MATGQQLVDAARTWVGVPFRHQGRTRYGVDCIGLIICARAELVRDPAVFRTPTDYRRNPNGALLEHFPKFAVQIDKPEPGAVVVIGWPKQVHPSHVGIITPERIIHAYTAARAVVETGYREQWVRWTKSIWRMKGIEPCQT